MTSKMSPTARSADITPRTEQGGKFRWLLREIDASAAASFGSQLGIGPVAARVLYGRGFHDPAAARLFLYPSLDDLLDPLTMLGMPQAVERLRAAIAASEKILIYGDYDVDGTTSVVVLKKAIELAGGAAFFHVPDRFTEGYGMRAEVV
jgi:single-stranded-DNA-specific exonuclease